MIAFFACSGSSSDTPTDEPTPTDDTDGSTTHSAVPEHTAVPEGYPPTWAGMEQLFTEHCDVCHPATAGFNLHSAIANDITGGFGAYVVPFDPDGSRLWRAVSGQGLDMPPGALLPLETVDPMRVWIEAGAVVP